MAKKLWWRNSWNVFRWNKPNKSIKVKKADFITVEDEGKNKIKEQIKSSLDDGNLITKLFSLLQHMVLSSNALSFCLLWLLEVVVCSIWCCNFRSKRLDLVKNDNIFFWFSAFLFYLWTEDDTTRNMISYLECNLSVRSSFVLFIFLS